MNETRDRLLLPLLIPVCALAAIAGAVFGFSRVLLSLRPSAATGTALVVAFGALVSAAWIAGRKRVGGAALAGLVASVAGLAMLAGGIAIAAIGPEEEGGEAEAFAVTLAAAANAAAEGFAQTEISLPAGAPIAMTFDNRDPQVQHNVSVWETEDFTGSALFTGEIITGPATVEYRIPALATGTYFFRCDVHPTTMTGTIVAGEGGETGGGGTGGGGTAGAEASISAADIAFDTGSLTLPAGEEVTLAFDNQDAVPHNFAIYTDESLTSPLFQGEVLAGPGATKYSLPALEPGTYHFQCDLHPPTMNGTVIVE